MTTPTFIPDGTDLQLVHVLYRRTPEGWAYCDHAVSWAGIRAILARRLVGDEYAHYAISLQAEIGPSRVRELVNQVWPVPTASDKPEVAP